jgi:hypothetical protein
VPAAKHPPAEMPPTKQLCYVKHSYEWINLWKYVVCQPALKNTGLAVATFSDKKGMDIFPGMRRTMLITGHGKTATIEALKLLRWLGFLYRVSCGKGADSHEADVYMLCKPLTLDHVPMVVKKPLRDPTFDELPIAARKTAVVLNVHERLKGGGPLTEPGVVSLANHRWWSQRTTTTHLTNAYDHSAKQHAAPKTPTRQYDLADPEDRFDYVVDEVVRDLGYELNPAQVAAITEMLRDEKPLPLIINNAKSLRTEEAA